MADPVRIAWSHDERRLGGSRIYWLATVRPDGRPHIAPVWGVWMDNHLYFSTGLSTVKGCNLRANRHAALHLDNSEDVLIVEGTVEMIRDDVVRQRVDEAFAAKYVTIRSGKPYSLAMNGEAQLWAFAPSHALGWWEMAMDATSRRWSWGGGGSPAAAPGWRPFA